MKRSGFIVALLIISLSLLPLAPPPAAAQTGYGERLSVYVAGSDAAWFITASSINVTNPQIQSAEAIAGVSSYNLTAIRPASWTADFISFGPQGYGVLPVPFVPSQGAFLTVGATSFGDGSNAASKFGGYLLTTFRSISNGTGSFSFFAPLSFASIMPSTLLSLLPLSNGGFLAPITVSKFLGLASPMVTLSAQKTAGSGFVHQISVGSITGSGLDSTGRPNILNYFGTSPAFLQASNRSSSSTIELHFLDGVVVSDDNATLTNDRNAFSSSYLLTLKPGGRVSKINATVMQQPPELLATRAVDIGVLKPGSNMSVTISLTNLSNSTAIQSVTINDNWWKNTAGLKLVRGSSNISSSSLVPGQSTSPTYVLQYTGNATQQVLLPATPVAFTYLVGATTETGYASLNPLTISLGADQPVVFAYVSPSGPASNPVGSNESLKIVIKNVGTRAAASVVVGSSQLGGLAADGGTASTNLVASAPGLTKVNVTKSYTVSYATPAGQTVSLSTNALQSVFSHTPVKVGLGVLALNTSLTRLSGGPGYNLLLTMDLTNSGSANLASFAARATLPAGLSCGQASSNVTCSGNSLSLSYRLLTPGQKVHQSISFNVTQPVSFLFSPMSFSYRSSGYTLNGSSNAQPAPTGLVLTKQFSSSEFFPGMTSQVTVLAKNNGPFTVYNGTVTGGADSFDSLQANQTTTKTATSVTSGSNLSLSYGVKVGSATRSQPVTPATVRFFMGGTPFTISSASGSVRIDELLSANIVSSPSNPVEGSLFTLTIKVSNPAAVAVGDVRFQLPIPAGVAFSNPSNATLQNGVLGVSVGSLPANSSYSAQATVSASSGQTIPFKLASLSFSFSGQTLSGSLPSGGIGISENTATRYDIPIGIALLAVLFVAYEVRRMSAPTSTSTAPSSQK